MLKRSHFSRQDTLDKLSVDKSIPAKAGPTLSKKQFIDRMEHELDYLDIKMVIPNPDKEFKFFKKMLARGFTEDQIFDTWQAKVKKRGQFVSMYYVNEDIGGHDAKARFPGAHREYTEPPGEDD